MFKSLARSVRKRLRNRRNRSVERLHVEPLFGSVPADALILEIGGGYNPRFEKSRYPRAYHLDHASTADLRAKYGADPHVAHLVDRIQDIDFVFTGTPIESLVPPTLRFDLVFGSHVLEHQVDLVGHLQSIEKLLKPGGRVIHVVPDLRACFDALRYPSVTSDALLVHFKGPAIHQGKQVFDFFSRVIDRNVGHEMRNADFHGANLQYGLRRAHDAMRAAEHAGEPYTDIHAWTFTADSLRLLMIELRLLGLTNLAPRVVTPMYGNQFCVELCRIERRIEDEPPEVVAQLEHERFHLCQLLRFRH
jgi:SAM-dependent methyltransferase